MDNKNRSIIFKLLSIGSVIFVSVLIVGFAIRRIFYRDETRAWIKTLTEQYPIIVYPVFSVIFGVVSFSLICDLVKGEEKGAYVIVRILTCGGVTIYCAVEFILTLIDKF